MDSPEWFLFTLLRFIIPLAILRWPLAGILAAIGADAVLSHLLDANGGNPAYQAWDKVLDTYYLAIAAWVAYSWRDRAARAVALFAFGYRAVGVLLFLITGEQFVLFLFPNFFESFFIFYLVFRKFVQTGPLFNSGVMFTAIVTALLVPKLAQEFAMHVAFARLGDYIEITAPAWLGWLVSPDANLAYALQWPLFVALPVIVLLWRVGVFARLVSYVRKRL
jgi:hypothetical protein